MSRWPGPRWAVTATSGLAALALAACGSDAGVGGSSAASGTADRVEVLAGFYPLEYVTERVGGDRITVTSLTKAGTEPHDLELTPQDVAAVSEADLVVYLEGFQPAVDTAVADQAADRGLDVSTAARLDIPDDPHFWLDPTRLADVSAAVAKRLAEVAPEHAAVFTTNQADLAADLAGLDADFERGLASCASRDIVTSHDAFGYLAQRYRMRQVGIAGLSPDAEPDAGTLADVTAFVRENKVRTIYHETLVSPAIATTVAEETGAASAVLDPIEGLTEASEGGDYLAVMRANLANLRKGQPCP